MENIDEQLKISICSVLNPVSEDTVTGIIEAIKYAGLESLSDLEFVEEVDLILVLKPVQRRKLIKAWSEQIFHPAEESNSSSIQNSNSKEDNNLLLLQVYSKYTSKFSCSDLDLNIWSKIAGEVRAKTSLNCNEFQCLKQIDELRLKYEKCKNDDAATWTQAQLLYMKHAREAFETTKIREEDNDKEKQTAKEEKIEPPSEMCPVSVSSVTSTEPAASFTTHSNCSNLESCEIKVDGDKEKQTIKEEKIDISSEVYSATPIVPVSSVITTVPAALPHSTAIVHSDGSGDTENLEEGEITVPLANKLSYIPLQQCKWPKKKSDKLLQVYTKYKGTMACAGVDELNVWNKIAVEVQGDSSKFCCDGLQCRQRIKELMHEYEVIEARNITVREKANFFDKAKVAFGTTDNLDNPSAQQPSTMKLKKCGKKSYRRSLLLVYGKYKNEFLLPNVEEHRVWEKISKEMREIFFYDCGEELCRIDLLQMQQQYQTFKPTCAINKNIPHYFYQAQQVFETTHNLAFYPAEGSNSISIPNCNWTEDNNLLLLQVYSKYKSQFSCSDLDINMWCKIADEIRAKTSLNCSEFQCLKQIDELRLEYEKCKNHDATSWTQAQLIYMKHAKEAFETTKIRAVPATEISNNIPLRQCKWTRPRSIKLLEVYTKYRQEFTHLGADVLNVWNKIAVEVNGSSPKFCCDGLQCSKRIEEIKCDYDKIDIQNITNRKIGDFFDRAKKAFEITENLAQFSTQQRNTLKLNDCGKRNKDYHLTLLRVYAKYKLEFLLPGANERRVWEKIAKEMREVFSYNCGEFLCRADMFQMLQQYRTLTPASKNLPYYFYEAQQAFGTHNLGIFPPTYINNGYYLYSYN